MRIPWPLAAALPTGRLLAAAARASDCEALQTDAAVLPGSVVWEPLGSGSRPHLPAALTGPPWLRRRRSTRWAPCPWRASPASGRRTRRSWTGRCGGGRSAATPTAPPRWDVRWFRARRLGWVAQGLGHCTSHAAPGWRAPLLCVLRCQAMQLPRSVGTCARVRRLGV